MADTRYTNAALIAQLDAASAGKRREAEILLSVPVEGRETVKSHAYYMRNMVGGRPSDALRSAARAYKRGELTIEGENRDKVRRIRDANVHNRNSAVARARRELAQPAPVIGR